MSTARKPIDRGRIKRVTKHRRITTFICGESQTVAPLLVAEYLKLDDESPTGLVWAKENHGKRNMVSYRKAGSVAGRATGKDKSVTVKGHRVTVKRAIEMLKAHAEGRMLANSYTSWSLEKI